MSRKEAVGRIDCPLFKKPVGCGEHCGFCYAEYEEQFKTQLLRTITYCGLASETLRKVVTGSGS